MVSRKDFLAFLTQAFILIFGICLLDLSQSPTGGVDSQYMGYAKHQMLKSNPSNYCDKIIKKHKPSWYHGDWNIHCSDELHSPKNVNSTVYGVTIENSHNILISRKTPPNLMIYTIDHEYAHSVYFDHNLESSNNWKKWVVYLTDNYGVLENLTYFDRPNEILADNVSRCYNNMQSDLMGFATVNCGELYKLFPIYKSK